MKNFWILWISAVLTFAISVVAWAESVKIGNSDDGRDLENLRTLSTGPIVEARAKAIALLERLGTEGVSQLGSLKPELQNAAMFLATEDVKASAQGDHPDHQANDGKVYARTLAEPYAPVRFFPIAQSLSEEQLIKLHIHEALHRALPAPQRSDEHVVAEITLAITSPSATRDQISTTVERLIPRAPENLSYRKDLYPSQVSYALKSFSASHYQSSADIRRSHTIKSYLYPFGTDRNTFGLGFDFSLIERDGGMGSGPLGLSFRWKALTMRGFDFDLFGMLSLNTMSFQELKDSPFGRDVGEIGISIRKEIKRFYIENSLSVRSGGTSEQIIGMVTYTYSYGDVVEPSVHVGYVNNPWHFGGYLNFFLADHYSISGGSFSEDKGRFRVISVGPEVRYQMDNLVIGAQGRMIVNATADADLGHLGSLDTWVGRGGVEASIGYRF